MRMGKNQRQGGGRYRGRNQQQGGRSGGSMGGQGQGQGRGGPRRRGGYYEQRREFEPGPDTGGGDYLPLTPGAGVLEMHPNGYGFLRDPSTGFNRERTDPFVPGTMIEKFGLREGVLISGMVQHHRKQ